MEYAIFFVMLMVAGAVAVIALGLGLFLMILSAAGTVAGTVARAYRAARDRGKPETAVGRAL